MAKKKEPVKQTEDVSVSIAPPNFKTAVFQIKGDTPYVQLKFSEKALNTMKEKQQLGSQAGKGRKREAKDFEALFAQAMHTTSDGKQGIPSTAFRQALVRACATVDYKMTVAKSSIFVHADGFAKDGTPLVFIRKGKPHYCEHPVRNATGVADIRVRAMWDEGWEAQVRIRYDADRFTVSDIANLLMRAGIQVGIGEGRPFSKNSCGMGWGTFEIVQK
jgi:hypothetical protein